MALVVMAGASLNMGTATAGKPKKKTNEPAAQQQLKLVTLSDSLSYAAGKASTLGLIEYLQRQYQVDTAYMSDVVDGIKEALELGADPHFKARAAGAQIAKLAMERILPGTQEQFLGTRDSITAEFFYAGFISELLSDSSIYTMETARKFFEEHLKASQEASQKAYIEKNTRWLAENKAKPGVKTTASGLQYKVLRAGNGPVPSKDDKVTVKYEGQLIDGTVFDSSYKRDPQTSSFGVGQVIKGWTEALCMMPVGSKWELYIPQELAYGDRQAGTIKPYSTLIFTVELEAMEAATTKK